jgi:hypothetical protein
MEVNNIKNIYLYEVIALRDRSANIFRGEVIFFTKFLQKSGKIGSAPNSVDISFNCSP